MDIFISWSGARSQGVAIALRAFLVTVVTTSRPWMSANGIAPGQRWLQEIGGQLSDANFGILCVTPENQGAPWLNFEAGALGKSLEEGLVVPYLFNMTPSNLLPGPLTQFQALQAAKEDTYRLVATINSKSGAPLDPEVLNTLFRRGWPDLESQLAKIPNPTLEDQGPERDDSAKLDEVLELVREISRSPKLSSKEEHSVAPPPSWSQVRNLAGPQLKAFLMPAKVTIHPEESLVTVRYGEAHGFHAAQVKVRYQELQSLVHKTLGSDYKVRLLFAEAVTDNAVNRASPSQTSTAHGLPPTFTLPPQEDLPDEEDLPF